MHVPALTVNRLCGSGFQSIVYGAQELELGVGSVSLCGGSENMSQAPHTLYGARFGTKLGQDLKVSEGLNFFGFIIFGPEITNSWGNILIETTY